MSFIPTGLLNDIKKLANIEKEGEVIAYPTINNTKKKRIRNHNRKKRNSNIELNKIETKGSQLPLLNEKIVLKNDKSNIIDRISLNSEIVNVNNNNISTSSIQNNKISTKNNLIKSNNKNIDHLNENLKNNQNYFNESIKNPNSSNKEEIINIKRNNTISPIEEPTFQYLLTKEKKTNSEKIKLKKELAFLYDISNNLEDNNSNVLMEKENNEIKQENHIKTIVNEIIPKISETSNINVKNTLIDGPNKLLNKSDNQKYSKNEVDLLTKIVIPKGLNPKELNLINNENDDNEVYFHLNNNNNSTFNNINNIIIYII